MSEFKGLVTGIGSLPHKDAERALDLIFQYAPHIPFWPQLPKRCAQEGMVTQFSEGLPDFQAADKEKELERFYEKIISHDIEYFRISQDYALGLHRFYQRLEKSNLKEIKFIKCQISGPFSFAASIKDKNGIALLHDRVSMQVIIKGLMMKALWQIKFFERFGKKIILFVDEPYLGCFGSAYTPINREDVVASLSELSEGIKAEGALVGVHCCGNTDWSILTEIKSIEIISFDAFSFLDKFILYAQDLKDFLERQGVICWGIVPTQEFSAKETPDLLIEKIRYGIETLTKKGLDRDLLSTNLLLSPACGLGSLDIDKADKIFKLLSETSSLIIKRFLKKT